MCGGAFYYGPGAGRGRLFKRRFSGQPWWYITREEALEALEEYQKDLEQQLAEVVSRIGKLKKEKEGAK